MALCIDYIVLCGDILKVYHNYLCLTVLLAVDHYLSIVTLTNADVM
jgi:hypothetical protein